MPKTVEEAFDEASMDLLASGGVAVVDGWLGREAALALRDSLLALATLGCFVPSRVGAGARRQEASAIRGDTVCWFDEGAEAGGCNGRLGVTPGAEVAAFLARMVLLRDHLNRSCFLSLASTECHAASYEPGTFYGAHLDSTPGGNRRTISFSHYLSERGEGEQGGCLRHHGADSGPVDVEPLFDRLVVFRSRSVLHEVLPVVSRRLSMTGWMSIA